MADFDALTAAGVLADATLAPLAGAAALGERQARRLAALLAAAQARSPLYAQLLRGIDVRRAPLAALPVARKAELMQRFDEWVADPALRLAALRRYVADAGNIGRPFLGRYLVWESSGSSGEPGLFVQDAQALAVYDVLEWLRRPEPQGLDSGLNPWLPRPRYAFVGATSGHFASIATLQRLRRLNPLLAPQLHAVSFLQPVRRWCAELQALAPTVIATYPSAAVLLAEQCAAGRVHMAPREVWTGGETLTPAMRRYVRDKLRCRVIDSYGASEFLPLAGECRCGHLHVNSDWALLEPVDAAGRPVPPGTPSASVLLTNLANRVQPLIRYDLGDRVTLAAGPCACGSALPVIEVQGRSGDLLALQGDRGAAVRLLPLALSTVLENEAGLFDFQLEQRNARELVLRTHQRGEAAAQALQRGRHALLRYLQAEGAAQVRIELEPGPPLCSPRSGKVQRIVARH